MTIQCYLEGNDTKEMRERYYAEGNPIRCLNGVETENDILRIWSEEHSLDFHLFLIMRIKILRAIKNNNNPYGLLLMEGGI